MVPLLLIQLSSAAQAVLVADACNTFYVGADPALTVAGDVTTLSVVAEDDTFEVPGCSS